jgi:hypothetical protein
MTKGAIATLAEGVPRNDREKQKDCSIAAFHSVPLGRWLYHWLEDLKCM